MVEDTYGALIRRAYEDFESGDLDLLGVVMASDVVWHEPGRSSFGGDYKGPEAVLGFLGQLKALSGGRSRSRSWTCSVNRSGQSSFSVRRRQETVKNST